MWTLKNPLENCKVTFKFLVLVGVLLKFLHVYFILYALPFPYTVLQKERFGKIWEKIYCVPETVRFQKPIIFDNCRFFSTIWYRAYYNPKFVCFGTSSKCKWIKTNANLNYKIKQISVESLLLFHLPLFFKHIFLVLAECYMSWFKIDC